MKKSINIDRLKSDLSAFQSYIETHFEEFSHDPVDSGTLYEFGKQNYYILSSITLSNPFPC